MPIISDSTVKSSDSDGSSRNLLTTGSNINNNELANEFKKMPFRIFCASSGLTETQTNQLLAAKENQNLITNGLLIDMTNSEHYYNHGKTYIIINTSEINIFHI